MIKTQLVNIRTKTDMDNYMKAIEKNEYFHFPIHMIEKDKKFRIIRFDNYKCNDEQYDQLCTHKITEKDLEPIKR